MFLNNSNIICKNIANFKSIELFVTKNATLSDTVEKYSKRAYQDFVNRTIGIWSKLAKLRQIAGNLFRTVLEDFILLTLLQDFKIWSYQLTVCCPESEVVVSSLSIKQSTSIKIKCAIDITSLFDGYNQFLSYYQE